MKTIAMKFFFISLFLLGAIHFANAQAPSAIPYQAVARGAGGNLIANQNISLRFTIHDGTAGGTVVYQETKTTTTNALGLFNVNIGQGTVVTGTFSGINWASGAKFTQVEIDVAGGTSYVDIGTQQMMSVPYALYAASSGTGSSSQWNSSGNNIYNNNSGNVGIGTSSPNAPLQLSNSTANRKIVLYEAANNDNQFQGFGLNSGALRYQVNNTGDDHVFYAGTSPTASNELVRIKGNGNVGIGTSVPNNKLNVNGGNLSIYNGGNVLDEGGSLEFGVSALSNYSAMSAIKGALTFAVGSELQGGIAFSTRTFGAAGQSLIERMRINHNGNVGIGTTSPSAKLDVTGNVKITDGTEGEGKVLTSNANGLAHWSYPIQAVSSPTSTLLTQVSSPGVEYVIPGMSCSITVPAGQYAKLLISGSIVWDTDINCIICGYPIGKFYFAVDGVPLTNSGYPIYFNPTSSYSRGTETFSNYAWAVGPGTHTITMYVKNIETAPTRNLLILPINSTVIAIPN